MRDTLPTQGPWLNESAIVNLDDNAGVGTHWVAYKKRKSLIIYFDSFGNLPPPLELVRYFEKGVGSKLRLLYNYERKQQFNTVLCGHLCLQFLTTKTNENGS